MLVGIVTVVPGVPGTTTSADGTVMVSVEGAGDDAGGVPPAGTTIVEVKDDTTGDFCTVTGTTTVDVEDVTIGERCTVTGKTVFKVEDDRTGAGFIVTRITVLIVDGEGLDAGRCEVTGTTVVEAGDEAITTTAVEAGDEATTITAPEVGDEATTGTTAVEIGDEAFGTGCNRVRVTGTTSVEVVEEVDGADRSTVTGTRTVEVDEERIGAGGVTVATRTVTIVEDETISMTEPGKLVGDREGAGASAFYAIAVPELTVEGRAITIGGPAVATTGRTGTEKGEGREELSGREPPEPICVPWSVKLAQVRRVLFEE
jgi:hypothetical protein